MSTTQSITPRTLTSSAGMIVPAIADQRTPLGLLPAIEEAFAGANDGIVARQTLALVMEAMRDASAVVALYCHGGETTARALWPLSVSLTKERQIVTLAYCTHRRAVKCFRLDRVLACHALTTPDDFAEEQ